MTSNEKVSRTGIGWTFLTNYTHVLFCLARQPDMVLREVAAAIGITERAVQRIVSDLVEAGILIKEKDGRRNHYRIDGRHRLRHPIESHRSVNDLLALASED